MIKQKQDEKTVRDRYRRDYPCIGRHQFNSRFLLCLQTCTSEETIFGVWCMMFVVSPLIGCLTPQQQFLSCWNNEHICMHLDSWGGLLPCA